MSEANKGESAPLSPRPPPGNGLQAQPQSHVSHHPVSGACCQNLPNSLRGPRPSSFRWISVIIPSLTPFRSVKIRSVCQSLYKSLSATFNPTFIPMHGLLLNALRHCQSPGGVLTSKSNNVHSKQRMIIPASMATIYIYIYIYI